MSKIYIYKQTVNQSNMINHIISVVNWSNLSNQLAFSVSLSSTLIVMALTTLFSSPLVSYTTALVFFSSQTVSKFLTKYCTVFLTYLYAFQMLLTSPSLNVLQLASFFLSCYSQVWYTLLILLILSQLYFDLRSSLLIVALAMSSS